MRLSGTRKCHTTVALADAEPGTPGLSLLIRGHERHCMDEREIDDSTTWRDWSAEHSAELDLLLLCARWPQRPSDRDAIRLLCCRQLDWGTFVELARHHRLVPLIAHTLQAALADGEGGWAECDAAQELAPDARQTLDLVRQMASQNAVRALHSLAEMRRLVQALAAEGVPVRVLKGIPLAQRVFGEMSLRATGDLDLLIDAGSIRQADRVLRVAGYRGLFHLERFSPRQMRFYRSHWKDIAYENAASGFAVDLHWRCFRNRAMAGGALCGNSASATISFGDFEVATLPPLETLLYLCVHGTLDGWVYLKSLADVAAQVRTMSVADLDVVAASAERYGVLPELTAALMLVRRYLAVDRWSDLLLAPEDRTVTHILQFAQRALERRGSLGGREAIGAGSMIGFEFGLRRSLRYRKEMLLRVLFRARMWQTFPLPDWLFWLYPLLSPVEWIVFRRRRALAKIEANSLRE